MVPVSDKYLYSHRTKRERQRCPSCGRLVAVNHLGLFTRHGAEHDAPGECEGSGGVALW